VSDGCRLCYAELVAARFSGPGQPYEGLAKWVEKPDGTRLPRWTGEIRVIEKHMADPLRWQKPRMIFTNSMSDIFHERLPVADLDRIVAVMGLATRHTFQPLTKRSARLKDYLSDPALPGRLMDAAKAVMPSQLWNGSLYQMGVELDRNGFLPNVWWGVSAEDQDAANRRIPDLLKAPAAVRWVSYEPALGPIDFTRIDLHGYPVNALTGVSRNGQDASLDWIVVGGESDQAPQPAHSFDINWALATQKACAEAGVAFFFKQLGSSPRWGQSDHWISDKMGKVEDDWPQPLKGAQAYPERVHAPA
jgi:protein gp37